jgi:glycosyltransferase involved in cell wall biosynthesis
MLVSVIVPAFNEAKLLADSLRSIRRALGALAARGWAAELIVCDNNSTDHTAELAQAEGARVVFEPINQIARARNTGAWAAGGDWLIFVDADSQPPPELFADVAETIACGDCLAGGSTVRIEGPQVLARAGTLSWNLISRLKRWAPGSFIFCEAAAFRRVGGFNQDLYASEEIELFERLKALARQQRRRIVILHRHPLLTSARKLHLYTTGEHLRFLVRTLMLRGRNLRSPQECYTWYDGRR